MYTVFGLTSNLKTLSHNAAPDSGFCKSPRACDRMGGLMFGVFFIILFCFCFCFPTGAFFKKKIINNNKLAEMGLCVCVEPKVSNEIAQGFLHSSLVPCFFVFYIDMSCWLFFGGEC